MSSYRVKEKIIDTSLVCAAAAVPNACVPGIDIAAIGGLWTSMMLTIADEHNITFEESPEVFIEYISVGIVTRWSGSRVFSRVLLVAMGFVLGGDGFAISNIDLNVALNAYYSWSLGRKMDEIFAVHEGERAGGEIALLIVKAVCHIPSMGELSDFVNDTGLSVSKLKEIIENSIVQ